MTSMQQYHKREMKMKMKKQKNVTYKKNGIWKIYIHNFFQFRRIK